MIGQTDAGPLRGSSAAGAVQSRASQIDAL